MNNLHAGTITDVGISRTVIDNTDLGASWIARSECTEVGSRDGIDADFLVGELLEDSCSLLSNYLY